MILVSHDRAFLNNVVTSSIVFEEQPDGNFAIREYIGGYDDWLRQRQPVEPDVKPKTAEKPATVAKTKPRKLSFKEQRELENLPARIEELESEQHALVEKMADPTLYQGDGSGAAQAKARLEAIENELGVAFVRWEKLLEIESQSQNG